VLDRAVALGFDAVCTGHYARIERSDHGVELHRAVDLAKDQSYVLGVLTTAQVGRSFFPLGGSTKTEVRAEASRRGLAVAEKPDSHDICFIPDGDTAGFLERRLGARPGPIVTEDGAEVGEHRGTHTFTVGQRRGLRLGNPAEDGQPRFVLDIAPVTNTVTVGPRSSLAVRRITGRRPIWAAARPVGPRRCLAQVRAHGEPMPAELIPPAAHDENPTLQVILDSPATGVAAGQAVVIYDGSRVLGSATIAGTAR
jgi:tRNA-specific 2-thiouridylase